MADNFEHNPNDVSSFVAEREDMGKHLTFHLFYRQTQPNPHACYDTPLFLQDGGTDLRLCWIWMTCWEAFSVDWKVVGFSTTPSSSLHLITVCEMLFILSKRVSAQEQLNCIACVATRLSPWRAQNANGQRRAV